MLKKEKKLEWIWNKIKCEAQLLSDCEPILSKFLNYTLLNHENLDSSLRYVLADKLATSIIPSFTIHEIIEEVYKEDPSIIFSAAEDIHAVRLRDPSVDKYSTPLLYLKGFHALQTYRISHWLWYKNRKSLAIYFQNQSAMFFGVDIHPAARIGYGIMLDHATGIVIGETAVVENNVSILHYVTLGGTGKIREGDRHPKIRKGVIIGTGATILGNIEVGKGAKIGAGSVVLSSIPSYTTAAGIPARIVRRKKINFQKEELSFNHIFFESGDGI